MKHDWKKGDPMYCFFCAILMSFSLALQGGVMKLSSPAFTYGHPIPQQFSCEGEDISPALVWHDVPQSTKSLALIMDDPDAPNGTWVHWVVFNLAPELSSLPENASIKNYKNAVEGTNSWGKTTYGGPCPPSGTHRYFFTLYALDIPITLTSSATKADLMNIMKKEHILAQATHMGTCAKRQK
jgi:Raf kinase inhibitor-like YbhB/YbcL family protein